MKKYVIALLASIAFTAAVLSWQDYQAQIKYATVYQLSLSLQVPRIYDNNESLGYRKYQRQRIAGEMLLLYDNSGKLADVQFTNVVNRTHKLSNGGNVTYNTALDTMVWPRFNAIGSNKTEKFKTASICFYAAAEPNYNKGEFDEDNALYIMLAGKGAFQTKQLQLKSASGYVSGTLGCGCKAYGHKSPTRKITFYGPGEVVDDVAAVFGTWKLKYKKTLEF